MIEEGFGSVPVPRCNAVGNVGNRVCGYLTVQAAKRGIEAFGGTLLSSRH